MKKGGSLKRTIGLQIKLLAESRTTLALELEVDTKISQLRQLVAAKLLEEMPALKEATLITKLVYPMVASLLTEGYVQQLEQDNFSIFDYRLPDKCKLVATVQTGFKWDIQQALTMVKVFRL